MASVLVPLTKILDEGAVGAAASLPPIPAASNRIVVVFVAPYSGASTSQPPSSINSNGVTANLLAGDTVARERASLGVYLFGESDIAEISGQSITSTATGAQKSVFYAVLQDCDPSVVDFASAYSSTTATLTMPLSRLAESLTLAVAFSSTTGQTLTMTQPANDAVIALASGRQVTYGEQSEATTQAVDHTVAGNARTSAIVVNFRNAAVSQSITSVNGGAGIRAGSTGNTADAAGFSAPPNSGTYGSLALSSVTGTATNPVFSVPGYFDGEVYPDPTGTHALTLNAPGDETASINVPMLPPLGMAAVTIVEPVTESEKSDYLGDKMYLEDGYKIIFPTEVINEAGDVNDPENWGFQIYQNGKIRAVGDGTRECWRWADDTGIMTQQFVAVLDGGAIVVASKKIEAIKIPAKKISAKKIAAKKAA